MSDYSIERRDYSIEECIIQAETEIEKSLEFHEDSEYKMLCALRSIAYSNLAIAKGLKSGDSQ